MTPVLRPMAIRGTVRLPFLPRLLPPRPPRSAASAASPVKTAHHHVVKPRQVSSLADSAQGGILSYMAQHLELSIGSTTCLFNSYRYQMEGYHASNTSMAQSACWPFAIVHSAAISHS